MMCYSSFRNGFLSSLLAALSLAFTTTRASSKDPISESQIQERTCFQTSQPWSGKGNLGSDVAICYGIDPSLPSRIATWRDAGYRIHVMTGVSWGGYQDYLYGRFDGINHEDEAQTDRSGNKVSHGGDVYYMCPGTNYGKFLCVGVQRALDAGAEAIHLEEPEFWVRSGYSDGFKREWQNYYGEAWQPPYSSVDAQWRASKLKYFLYRRALQQVFDYVQDFNHRTGKQVRCYVPTHSLLNYCQWGIVSPESSLARLKGCDGYIAQVWTGTSRSPNRYRGEIRSRTFETAFLEYGTMQNLVRSTGRRIWYLNDPVQDDPNFDWNDYRTNWESTLVASLLQPEVARHEVAPWPERVFKGRYPHRGDGQLIPPAYATELQVVMNALNHLEQPRVEWDAGTSGIGLIVSDSMMFERGDPESGDPYMSHVYGLAMPLVKRGIPLAPVQLENVTIPGYLNGLRVLMLTYRGVKPLTPEVHTALADWVRRGGTLVVVDDDSDLYNHVREWWNSKKLKYATPREHLFEQLGLGGGQELRSVEGVKVGKGYVRWLRENPIALSTSAEGDRHIAAAISEAARVAGLKWRETNYLQLRRGPFVIAAGLDESISTAPKPIPGRFVNLFDPELRVQTNVVLAAGERLFLLDLGAAQMKKPDVLASGCRTWVTKQSSKELAAKLEGVADTDAIVLINAPNGRPSSVKLDGKELTDFKYSEQEHLAWVRFGNEARRRELEVRF